MHDLQTSSFVNAIKAWRFLVEPIGWYTKIHKDPLQQQTNLVINDQTLSSKLGILPTNSHQSDWDCSEEYLFIILMS
jgi:hypothetical protein